MCPEYIPSVLLRGWGVRERYKLNYPVRVFGPLDNNNSRKQRELAMLAKRYI